MKSKIIVILLTFFFSSHYVLAQKSNDDDQLKKANKLFENGQYAEAYPLFAHLLSLHKSDPEINYKYGATMLFGSEKKSEAIDYLNKSSSSITDDFRVYYFLGKAYQFNYEFEKAMNAFYEFQDLADEDLQEEFPVDVLIQQCKSGQELLKHIKEVLVIEKKNVSRDDFYRYYEMENLGGKILMAPEEFQTTLDKKKNHRPVIYAAPLSNIVYFSSYGKSGNTGKDIYFASRKANGSWSEANKLPAPVNSPANEDFPFFHSDGKTLFFSSDGPQSMGGYDIFRTSFNPSTGSYSTPVNLNFAINTPDNDVFYLADSLNQIAYFASSRASKQNRMDIYKVRVDLVPSNMILVKGTFSSENDSRLKKAKITIEEDQSKRQIAVLKTDRKGNYLIDFKKGGKYNFYVEAGDNGVVHSGTVEVPRLTEMTAFAQELTMVDDGGVERLVIKNFFTEPLDEDIQALSAEILRQRASLDRSSDAELMASEVVIAEEPEESDFNSLYMEMAATKVGSNESLANYALTKSSELNELNLNYASIAVSAHNESIDIEKQAEQIILQADQSLQAYENASSVTDKVTWLKKSVELRVNGETQVMSGMAAAKAAKDLNHSVAERKKLSDRYNEVGNQLIKAIELKDDSLFRVQIAELNRLEDEIKKPDRGIFSPDNLLTENRQNASEQRNILLQRAEGLRSEKNETLALIRRKETQLKNAEEKDQPAIQKQIDQAKRNLTTLTDENEKAWQSFRELDLEASLYSQSVVMSSDWSSAYTEKTLMDDQVVALLNQYADQQERLDQLIETESKALLAVGYTAEELLQSTSSVAAITPKEQEGDKSMVVNQQPTVLSQVDPDYESNRQEILSSTQNTTNLQLLIELDQALLARVNSKLQSGDSALSSDSLTHLKTELEKALISQKEAFETHIMAHPNPELTMNYYVPNFQEKLDEAAPAGVSELQRLQNQQAIMQEADVKLQQDLDSINDISLSSVSIDRFREVTEQQTALRNHLAELEMKMHRNQEQIDSLTSAIVSIPSDSELIETVYPNYTNKIESVNAIEDLDVKSTELVQVNESLIARINEQIIELEQSKSQADSNEEKVIEGKISAFQSVKFEKENEIQEALNLLAASELVAAEIDQNVDDQPLAIAPVTIDDINPDFKSDYQTLLNEDKPPLEKTELAIGLYTALLDQFDQKIAIEQSKEGNGNAAEFLVLKNQVSLTNDSLVASMAILEETTAEIENDFNPQFNDELKQKAQAYEQQARLEQTGQALNAWMVQSAVVVNPGLMLPPSSLDQSKNEEAINALEKLDEDLVAIDQQLASGSGAEEAIITQKKELTDQRITTENQLLVDEVGAIIQDIEYREKRAPSDEKPTALTLENSQLAQTRLSEAQGLNGAARNEKLREAYVYSLMALSEANRAAGIGMAASSQVAIIPQQALLIEPGTVPTESDLLTNQTQLQNIQTENQLVLQNLNEAGFTASDPTYQRHLQLDSIVRSALVINNEALIEKRTKESEIEMAAQSQMDGIKQEANVLNESGSGWTEEQKAAIQENDTIKAYFDQQALVQAMENKMVELDIDYADYIKRAEEEKLLIVTDFSTGSYNHESMMEKLSANQRHYQAASVWYAKADSVDQTRDIFKDNQQMIIAEKKNMLAALSENQTDQVFAIETNNLVALVEPGPSGEEMPNNDLALNENEDITNDDLALNQDDDAKETTANDIESEIQPAMDEQADEEAVALKDEDSSENAATDDTESSNQISTGEQNLGIVEQERSDNLTSSQNNPGINQGFMFEKDELFYSEQDPIPVDPPLPTGVIFKVQVGAFRNAINPAQFKGLTPLSAERLANGITRYTLGIFYDINAAQSAKDQVRELGYTDAFVVAFQNGERISVSSAQQLLGVNVEVVDLAENQDQIGAQEGLVGQEGQEIRTTGYYNDPRSIPAQEVESVGRLFYTVQIGVYSKPLSAGTLENISAINVEQTGQGYLRYSSGKFSDYFDAEVHKNKMIENGIPDAFVTAYFQGSRVSLNRAQTLILTQPGVVNDNDIKPFQFDEKNIIPIADSSEVDISINDDALESTASNVFSNAQPGDLRFMIFIGEFGKEIPNEIASAILANTDAGIRTSKIGDRTRFTTREMSNDLDAKAWLNRFVEAGVSTARMVYMLDGNEISEVDAQQILNR